MNHALGVFPPRSLRGRGAEKPFQRDVGSGKPNPGNPVEALRYALWTVMQLLPAS